MTAAIRIASPHKCHKHHRNLPHNPHCTAEQAAQSIHALNHHYAATFFPSRAVLTAHLAVQCLAGARLPQEPTIHAINPITNHQRHPSTTATNSVTKISIPNGIHAPDDRCSLSGNPLPIEVHCRGHIGPVPPSTTCAAHQPLLSSLGLNPCGVGQRTWQCSCMNRGIQPEHVGKSVSIIISCGEGGKRHDRSCM